MGFSVSWMASILGADLRQHGFDGVSGEAPVCEDGVLVDRGPHLHREDVVVVSPPGVGEEYVGVIIDEELGQQRQSMGEADSTERQRHRALARGFQASLPGRPQRLVSTLRRVQRCVL